MTFCLVQLNGPSPGSSFAFADHKEPVTLGRDSSCLLPIDDALASRTHARIWCSGQTWRIEDCGSRNGTQVNSRTVDQGVLLPGDLIRIGDRLLVFLEETTTFDPLNMRPSVLAGSTGIVRIRAADEGEPLLDRVRQESTSRSVHNVSLLCHLATQLYRQSNTAELVQLIRDTARRATAAGVVQIWFAGRDGRLQRHDAGESQAVADQDAHLMASMAIENNEALLTDLVDTPSDTNETAEIRGTWISVPIPGGKLPRGAIECGQPADSQAFDLSDLELVVAIAHLFGPALHVIEQQEQLQRANQQLRGRIGERSLLVGSSRVMGDLHDQIGRIAPAGSNVLVLGESGTGKELVAQTLHDMSSRAAGPFVTVNCAAFGDSLLESELFGHEKGAFTGADHRRQGQFERAHQGTMFLDEVGEMSLACQAKLLRVLEGHPFARLGGSEPVHADVRFVAATHRDLPTLVREGRFREDVYFRLRVIELCLPPLRDREGDINELAVRFLDQFRREMGRGPSRFSHAAASVVADYHWPGNVRELKNAVERAVVLGHGEEVLPEDLGLTRPSDQAVADSPLATLADAERRHIERVLQASEGNKTKACQILGIRRGTLYKKLAKESTSPAKPENPQ